MVYKATVAAPGGRQKIRPVRDCQHGLTRVDTSCHPSTSGMRPAHGSHLGLKYNGPHSRCDTFHSTTQGLAVLVGASQ